MNKIKKACSENKAGCDRWWSTAAPMIHRYGARGIYYIRNVHHSSGETIAFPIYDGHGNMVYTLSRAANDTFSLGNKRVYGAWGDLRYDGNQGSGPNTQYCANLGHKKDNGSGLTYMRARYYEPWTGRFLSEDAARDNLNWYVYAANSPTVNKDFDGQVTYSDIMFWGEAEAMKAAVLRLGLSAIGRAEQLALTLMTKYSALGALIGAGMTRRGDQFFWMFRDAAGNLHRVRFDMVAGILKHDSSGSNAGIPHHMMKYQDLIKEMIKLFDDG